MKKIGLRIDVDSWYGTERGVPALLELFEQQNICGSFFFSVGPDHMGRHLWRLVKPTFLLKMLRSKAATTYGWPLLLAGTAWPGKLIGKGLAPIIQQTAKTQEVGLHAWDHYAWQTGIGRWSQAKIVENIRQGVDTLQTIIGDTVTCSAVAGWRADERVVSAKQQFNFRYNSDCRGTSPFRPQLSQGQPGTLQIPVTLPTWDEVVGRVTSLDNFNDFILTCFKQSAQNAVYTIHAEVEGISGLSGFAQLIERCKRAGIQFCPLSELIPEDTTNVPLGNIVRSHIPGREGWLGQQQIID